MPPAPLLDYYPAMAHDPKSNPHLLAGIRVRLLVIEEALHRMELLLSTPPPETILEEQPNDTNETQQKEIAQKIEKVRRILRDLKKKFDFEVTSRPAKKRLMAEAARLWTVAGNLESKRLKGYGQIPPDVASAIQHPAEELQKIFKEIEKILSL